MPTSQVFLGVNDSFGTRKFNPWHQKTIFEYTRRDVPDSSNYQSRCLTVLSGK